MSFQIRFLLASLGVTTAYALLYFVGEAAMILMLPLGFGGLIAAVLACGGYLAPSKALFTYEKEPVSVEDRYKTLGWLSPLALAFLGMWLGSFYADGYDSGRIIPYLFFGIPFAIIAIGSIVGLFSGPSRKSGFAVIGGLATVAVGIWLMIGPSAAEKQVISKFEKEHCNTPGASAVLESYREEIRESIFTYKMKDMVHERVGDKVVLCRINSRVAFEAACTAKGGETYWRRNAIQTGWFSWSAENFHRACTKDLG